MKILFNSYRTDLVELKGGLNEDVGSLELLPGELIDCRNYMINTGSYGGYISTAGYERIDGRVIPSRYESYLLTVKDAQREVEAETILISSYGAIAVAKTASVLLSADLSLGTGVIQIEALIVSGSLSTAEKPSQPLHQRKSRLTHSYRL
jgi:hypothetical protein